MLFGMSSEKYQPFCSEIGTVSSHMPLAIFHNWQNIKGTFTKTDQSMQKIKVMMRNMCLQN